MSDQQFAAFCILLVVLISVGGYFYHLIREKKKQEVNDKKLEKIHPVLNPNQPESIRPTMMPTRQSIGREVATTLFYNSSLTAEEVTWFLDEFASSTWYDNEGPMNQSFITKYSSAELLVILKNRHSMTVALVKALLWLRTVKNVDVYGPDQVMLTEYKNIYDFMVAYFGEVVIVQDNERDNVVLASVSNKYWGLAEYLFEGNEETKGASVRMRVIPRPKNQKVDYGVWYTIEDGIIKERHATVITIDFKLYNYMSSDFYDAEDCFVAKNDYGTLKLYRPKIIEGKKAALEIEAMASFIQPALVELRNLKKYTPEEYEKAVNIDINQKASIIQRCLKKGFAVGVYNEENSHIPMMVFDIRPFPYDRGEHKGAMVWMISNFNNQWFTLSEAEIVTDWSHIDMSNVQGIKLYQHNRFLNEN